MDGQEADPGERRKGHLALVAVQCMYGAFPVVAAFAFQGLAPRAVVAWRVVLGALILGAIALVSHGKQALAPLRHRRDLLLLCACASLGVLGNQVLAMEGMSRTGATQAGLIMSTIPAFTCILAVLVGQEPLRPMRAGGILLAMTGAAIAVFAYHGPAEEAGERLVGNLLLVSNCLFFSGYLVLSRRLLATYPARVVVAWVYVLPVLVLPAVLYGVDPIPADIGPEPWIALGLIILFPTVLAYSLNAFALKRVDASVAAAFVTLQPFIAGTGGALILGEVIGWAEGIAVGFVVAGLMLVARPAGSRAGVKASAVPEPGE